MPKKPNEYRVVLSGDAVQAVIAPLDPAAAAYWSKKPGEALHHQTYNIRDDGDRTDDEYQLPNWGDFENGLYLEGPELHNGSLEVFDADGEVVYEADLGSEEFQSAHLDDSIEYTEKNGFKQQGPVFVAYTDYTGILEGEILSDEEFDPTSMYIIVSQMEETQAFISRIVYDGKDVVLSGSGRYRTEFAGIYNVEGEPVRHWQDIKDEE